MLITPLLALKSPCLLGFSMPSTIELCSSAPLSERGLLTQRQEARLCLPEIPSLHPTPSRLQLLLCSPRGSLTGRGPSAPRTAGKAAFSLWLPFPRRRKERGRPTPTRGYLAG